MQIFNTDNINFLQVVRVVNIIVPAQEAKLGPPVGPILGQVKIKVKDFCTLFNEATKNFEKELPLKVKVFVYTNDNFEFLINPPSTAFLILNLLKFNKTRELFLLDVYKIVKIKKLELTNLSEKLIFKNILNIIKKLDIKLKI